MTRQVSLQERLKGRFDGSIPDAFQANPYYAQIGTYVADRPQILSLFESIPDDCRVPAQLFAAVRYLLSSGIETPLRSYFDAPAVRDYRDRMGPAFLAFCEEYADELLQVMNLYQVRQNEVHRCAALLPALMTVERMAQRPMGLIELGASAGLKLLFDRFHYEYPGLALGPNGASVRLSTQLSGDPIPWSLAMPRVDFRLGIDEQPLDVHDPDDERWLRSCVPVGDVARSQRLDAAIELAQRENPEVIQANLTMGVPWAADQVSDDLALCFVTSCFLERMSRNLQEVFAHRVAEIAEQRDVWWIALEPEGVVDLLGVPVPADQLVLGVHRFGPSGTFVRILALSSRDGKAIEGKHHEGGAVPLMPE